MAAQCNICEKGLEIPIYQSNTVSITSLCQIVPGTTEVFYCDSCAHIQTNEIEDIDNFYNNDYQLLIDSEEEDQIYSIDGDNKIYRYDHQAETLINLLGIPSNARILDYGCGKGATSKIVKNLRDDITPYFFDISDMYIPFWEKITDNDCWSVYEPKKQWAGLFDIVTSFFSLEHVTQPKAMLSTISSLLKDDGYFYCIVPNVMDNTADFVVVDHVNHFTELSIGKLMNEAGFEIIALNTEAHIAAMIVIAKKSGNPGVWPVTKTAEETRDRVNEMAEYWGHLCNKISGYESSLAENTDAAIYGSGFYGTYIMTCLRQQKRIKYYLDRDPYKHNKKLFNTQIIAPEKLPDTINTVFVGLNPSVAEKYIGMVDAWKDKHLNLFYL